MFHWLVYGHKRVTKIWYDYDKYFNWCVACKGVDYHPEKEEGKNVL